jgi:hypothetical protein
MIDGHGAWLEALLAVKAWFLEQNAPRDVREEMLQALDTLINGGTDRGWNPNIVNYRERGILGGDSGWCLHLETTAPRHGAWWTSAWSGVRIAAPYGGWRYPWEIKLYMPFTPETW